MIPSSARFVVVGAGVHGLSTAYHLAEEGADVLVLDKSRVGAGATGISGGIVRNFYLSAAMNELVQRSVEIFELDPGLFGFRQVGYVAVVPEAQADELELIAEQHAAIGYDSTLVRGAAATRAHMRASSPTGRRSDRQPRCTSGGAAGPMPARRSTRLRGWHAPRAPASSRESR